MKLALVIPNPNETSLFALQHIIFKCSPLALCLFISLSCIKNRDEVHRVFLN